MKAVLALALALAIPAAAADYQPSAGVPAADPVTGISTSLTTDYSATAAGGVTGKGYGYGASGAVASASQGAQAGAQGCPSIVVVWEFGL